MYLDDCFNFKRIPENINSKEVSETVKIVCDILNDKNVAQQIESVSKFVISSEDRVFVPVTKL